MAARLQTFPRKSRLFRNAALPCQKLLMKTKRRAKASNVSRERFGEASRDETLCVAARLVGRGLPYRRYARIENAKTSLEGGRIFVGGQKNLRGKMRAAKAAYSIGLIFRRISGEIREVKVSKAAEALYALITRGTACLRGSTASRVRISGSIATNVTTT